MNVFKIDADEIFPFNTILLWSTILGYILSLDIINTVVSLAWKCMRWSFRKKEKFGDNNNKNNVLCLNANKRGKGHRGRESSRLSETIYFVLATPFRFDRPRRRVRRP